MNRLFTKCLAGGVALAIVVSASAVMALPVYLDLGSTTDPVLPGGDMWNQLGGTEVAVGNMIADLQDVIGDPTGVGVSVTDNFQFENNTGGAAWASPSWAVVGMVSDSFSIDSNNTSATSEVGAITFTGLDDSLVYRFEVLSSRDGPAPRAAFFTLGGNAPDNHVGSFDAKTDGTDANKVMVWAGATSTAGALVLTMTVDETITGNRFAYLNAVRFEVIPEPGSIALMGIGMISMLFRGRRRS